MPLQLLDKCYHFTHVDNLASIAERGLLSHNAVRASRIERVDISDHDVQNRRANRIDPIHGRRIHDYVPFYFNPRNSMLYRLASHGLQHPLVMIEVDLNVVKEHAAIYSDGNAACRNTQFTDSMDDLTDTFDVICAPRWNDVEDGGRIRCAEVLIPDHFESKLISDIYCQNEDVACYVRNELGYQITVDRTMFF